MMEFVAFLILAWIVIEVVRAVIEQFVVFFSGLYAFGCLIGRGVVGLFQAIDQNRRSESK